MTSHVHKVFRSLTDDLGSLVVTFVIIFVFFHTIVSPFQVVGNSMVPKFQDGELVLANVLGFEDLLVYKADFGNLQRGDIVIFKAPPHPRDSYIKRVIGLPGETIRLQDGTVYLNNKKLNESSYLSPTVKTYGEAWLRDGVTIQVPQDSYFVLGDNRLDSSDSRQWGFITKKEVQGSAIFVYWPPTQARIIQNPL